MKLVKLGFRNLLRYKRRTIITAFAVAMGLMMFILMDSLLMGVSEDSIINIMRYESGSGRIVTPAYWEDRESRPLKETLPPELGQKLTDEGVSWTPRIELTGELIFRGAPWEESGYLAVEVVALDPERDGDVYDLNRVVSEGHFLTPDEEGVLLGRWLAEDMGAQVGYPVSLRVKTRFGSEELLELEVAGILDCPDPYVNTGVVFIDLTVADDYLEMDGLYTQAVVSLGPNPQPPRGSVEKLHHLLAGTGAEFHSWEEWAADFMAIAAGKQNSAYAILSLVVLIAAIGISNTVLMSLFERTRELGMLRALGMTDGDLRKTFLIEAVGIGLLGGIVGIIWGAGANLILVKIGINYGNLLKDMKIGYRVSGMMYGVWILRDYLISLVAGVAICGTISLLVTRKLTGMKITDCLRYT
ncbi:MAG: FtsX-like permease family protein [Spirochaetales bacterium]|nr:FtsX-like permease family protein [Spirochaetales bacterium]